jgi:hypothetical protein
MAAVLFVRVMQAMAKTLMPLVWMEAEIVTPEFRFHNKETKAKQSFYFSTFFEFLVASNNAMVANTMRGALHPDAKCWNFKNKL